MAVADEIRDFYQKNFQRFIKKIPKNRLIWKHSRIFFFTKIGSNYLSEILQNKSMVSCMYFSSDFYLDISRLILPGILLGICSRFHLGILQRFV